MLARTNAATVGSGSPRASATRGICSRAFSGEMYGSTPEKLAVMASAGTWAGVTGCPGTESCSAMVCRR